MALNSIHQFFFLSLTITFHWVHLRNTSNQGSSYMNLTDLLSAQDLCFDGFIQLMTNITFGMN